MMANTLSILRILLLPPLLGSLYRDQQSPSLTTLLILIAAALSDLADGFLARRYGQASQLGRILDPLADKLFLGGLGVGLFLWRGFPAWLLLCILLRDSVILVVGSYLLRTYNKVIRPNYFGKYATVSLVMVGLAYLIEEGAPWRSALGVLAGVMLVVSSLSYALVLRRTLAELQRPSAPPESMKYHSA